MASPQTTESTNEIEQLFNLGAHLGHRKSRVHPKSYKYIYKVINGVSIIDLTKTVELLNKAKTFMEQQAKEGKSILVVATKKNIAAFTSEICTSHKIPYTTSKWLPGLLTNFDTIIENVKKMEEMKSNRDSGAWDQFVKHERTRMSKELYKLERFYRGLEGMRKRPDMIFIIDVRKEKNALKEAQTYKLPVVAIVDTNANPETVDYPIIMNDDAPEVVQHVLTDLLGIYAKNYQEPKKKTEAEKEAENTEAKAEPAAPAKKAAKAEKSEKAPAKKAVEKKEAATEAPAKEAAEAKADTKEEKKAPAKKATAKK
jgi:small subunit ribosomal protein S2